MCPGWVETAMIGVQAAAAGLSADEAEALYTKDQLIERFIQPQEVSNAVLWMCSDFAAPRPLVTGNTSVNMTAWYLCHL